ncbi:MAG: TVP38/TMEM64 family protein [Pseudomonadota bacterium]|nr:TVP38/TMEM64 family protein [Pseudomonadota bacterium]
MAETGSKDTSGAEKKPVFPIRRIVPLLLLAAGLAGFFIFGLNKYFSLDVLKTHRESCQFWVKNYGAVAPVVFMLIYSLAVAFSVPGAAFVTIAAGFIFGPYFGTIYAVIGATIGAVIVFLAAKYALGAILRPKAYPALKRMEAGFRENEISYMLVLRLIPLFPFCLVNLVPAFLGVSLRSYTIGTVIGIIPGAFVYALVGAGAGEILDAGGDLKLGIISDARFFAPILGLAFLACLPVLYKKLRGHKVLKSK